MDRQISPLREEFLMQYMTARSRGMESQFRAPIVVAPPIAGRNELNGRIAAVAITIVSKHRVTDSKDRESVAAIEQLIRLRC